MKQNPSRFLTKEKKKFEELNPIINRLYNGQIHEQNLKKIQTIKS